VPISQLSVGRPVSNPADVVYETMRLDMRVLEVDPIHRRIVLAVTNIPEDQPPRPETPPTIHTEEGEQIIPAIIPE
jgi:small subunit ribosomal protein S1